MIGETHSWDAVAMVGLALGDTEWHGVGNSAKTMEGNGVMSVHNTYR